MLNSFLVAMLFATLILLGITRLTADRLVRQHHGQKKDFFRAHPIQPGDIIFLGDSLTDGCRWEEMFPGLSIKNRGINADTTAGVLKRLPDILDGKPKAIFLLIGTNDLPWYEYKPDSDILADYKHILQTCREESPETRLYVQSLLPRHPMYSKRIQRLNRQYRSLAELYQCTFIDLFPHFTGRDGGLKIELTNDRLHLLAEGYAIWRNLLVPYLKEYGPVAD
jgi:lysophospholipase L1-like esterase